MSRMTLDLVAPTWAIQARRWPAWAWVILWFSGALALGLLWKTQSLDADVRRLQAEHRDLQQRLEAPLTVASPQSSRLTPYQLQATQQAVRSLNTPWGGILAALDNAASPQVALLDLSVQADQASLKITAEARRSDDMLAWMEKLKKEPQWASIVLSSHQINEQDRNKPLRFELIFTRSEQP